MSWSLSAAAAWPVRAPRSAGGGGEESRFTTLLTPAPATVRAPVGSWPRWPRPTCAQANAASTAAIVWGEQAPARLAALGLACRLARSDGRVVVLGGWPADEAGAHGQPDDAGPAGEAA